MDLEKSLKKICIIIFIFFSYFSWRETSTYVVCSGHKAAVSYFNFPHQLNPGIPAKSDYKYKCIKNINQS